MCFGLLQQHRLQVPPVKAPKAANSSAYPLSQLCYQLPTTQYPQSRDGEVVCTPEWTECFTARGKLDEDQGRDWCLEGSPATTSRGTRLLFLLLNQGPWLKFIQGMPWKGLSPELVLSPLQRRSLEPLFQQVSRSGRQRDRVGLSGT